MKYVVVIYLLLVKRSCDMESQGKQAGFTVPILLPISGQLLRSCVSSLRHRQ